MTKEQWNPELDAEENYNVGIKLGKLSQMKKELKFLKKLLEELPHAESNGEEEFNIDYPMLEERIARLEKEVK